MSQLKKNPLEWSVFAVSLVLVLGTLGYLVRKGAVMGENPPDLAVELGAPARGTGGHFAVPVTAVNRGDETAEEVVIEVTLTVGEGEESGEITIPFIPREAKREGWVTFSKDPAGGELKARVRGYNKP